MQCDDPLVEIIASEELLAGRLCAVVERTKLQLERCHLAQVTPVVIRVTNDPHPTGLMGHFSMMGNRIELLPPGGIDKVLDAQSAYRKIPAEEFFDSIIVHELTHALFLETNCGLETCLAGHEYIAYAMQLDALSSESRKAFLEALPAEVPVDLAWFSSDRLHETPEVFAAGAWRHFAQPDKGCAFVGALLSGESTFPSVFE